MIAPRTTAPVLTEELRGRLAQEARKAWLAAPIDLVQDSSWLFVVDAVAAGLGGTEGRMTGTALETLTDREQRDLTTLEAVTIVVTQEHIDKGTVSQDPIELAVLEAVPEAVRAQDWYMDASVREMCVTVWLNQDDYRTLAFTLTPEAFDFIEIALEVRIGRGRIVSKG